jgi:hypothetical protein
MVASTFVLDTVTGMTASSSTAVAAEQPSGQPTPVDSTHVLAAVASALRASSASTALPSVSATVASVDGHDWALLEAWALALTLVNWAALRAVPEELHDFL